MGNELKAIVNVARQRAIMRLTNIHPVEFERLKSEEIARAVIKSIDSTSINPKKGDKK